MILDDAVIRRAISDARKGVNQYLWLMRSLYKVDVSQDHEFQRNYNYFYRVRQRSKEWYSTYYRLLEDRKKTGANFAEILDSLWDTLSRYEPSFSSKLVATLDPTRPIWDKFVLINTGLCAPSYSSLNKKEEAKSVYSEICNWYSMTLASTEGQHIIELFNEEIPERDEISDLKKLDFVLWQTRM